MPSTPGGSPERLDRLSRQAQLRASATFAAAPLDDLLRAQRDRARRAADGLWRRDPAIWSNDAGVQRSIANRLGWMAAPAAMRLELDRLRAFAEGVRRDGTTDVVLLGMGGSSLAPEVLRTVVGVADGWPSFHVLDSTDPAAVLAASTPPEKTLYLLASKSGTTIEPNCLAAYFADRLQQAGISRWASRFVAITDEGTALATRAREEGFREIFINPSDIGGRFSAVSLFGLVPAALMGHDLDSFVDWATAMIEASMPGDDIEANPAVGLGLLLGTAARAGRDKLTLALPPSLEPFGLWVEQLVAESTGKQGVGIVPVTEALARQDATISGDRVLVRILPSWEKATAAPVNGGVPGATITMPELAALGAEFVRWEIATAIAGALLNVNPFDEPNVQQAKDATRTLLTGYASSGRLPQAPPDRTDADGVTWDVSPAAREQLGDRDPEDFLVTAGPGDYVALLAYLGPSEAVDAALGDFRRAAPARTGLATTAGMGPRYLHSTGQLHKGGPNIGVFIIVTATPARDVDIPGEPFSFGALELAQALGDFNSLVTLGRRALHVHLPAPDDRLRRVLDRLLAARPRA